ncbi:hypothetical protein PM3016_1308 [Paenibacillus mucilaginosus 3016]|uniref:Uncharacterized protein n=1 Tax=Paenibacillus mucilaginosus 3016 TaxID=1116391 RepID=H6NC43_9BACL|nr:hypothetical protein [Paenibacillus mucilaginosus]AFC28236.1 hypothetical protein PM3016_1308 [Paenibacillus mucilaginosus 3016]WFA17056.1 hypothetical protein ERY13_06840 [Paenibacillus mucilaginosus]
MLNLGELEELHADIQSVHEIVQSLKARVDGQEIGIRICRNANGHFFYELSHTYRGADAADPEVGVVNSFDSAEEAAKGALRSAVLYYRSMDEGGRWHRNDSFLIQ